MVIPESARSLMTSRTSFYHLRVQGAGRLIEQDNVRLRWPWRGRIARPCFCPPDNFLGYSTFFSRSPTFFNSSSASSCACSFGTFFSRTGAKVIFSSTVMFGNALKSSNAIAHFLTAIVLSIFDLLIGAISTPSNVDFAAVRHFQKVQTPQKKCFFHFHLGPMMDTTSPIFTCCVDAAEHLSILQNLCINFLLS